MLLFQRIHEYKSAETIPANNLLYGDKFYL